MKIAVYLPSKQNRSSPLPFKGKNVITGETLAVTNKFYQRNEKAWFPIMGEFHFSRFSPSYWEDEIIKMKAGGINIVATYVFWIHHEEIEHQYIWTENRNLAAFISLCHENGVMVLLRIGPWAHGECRNGGFPDWLVQKNWRLRSNDIQYLQAVEIFYQQIFQQIEPFLFKKGGPIIGIQIENEYGHCGGLTGKDGQDHMMTLKRLAVKIGFEVPYYTATGWGGGIVVEGEMLPVLGAYADAPWDESTQELPASPNFVFSYLRNDENIGSDLNSMYAQNYTYNPDHYPYATAELGGGIQVTKHRRPIIKAEDTQAMIYCRIGSGANLIGYYMYHGGTNFIGEKSTLQESKATGYANDLPILSYDFQAPLGEYGQSHLSYAYLRILHLFLSDFGAEMAMTEFFIPEQSGKSGEDIESLRFSFRYGKEISFLFLNNHQRHRQMTQKQDIEISIQTEKNAILFQNLEMKDKETIILPFDWTFEGIKINTVNAQILCTIQTVEEKAVFLWNYQQGLKIDFDLSSVQEIIQEDTGKDFGCIRVLNKRGSWICFFYLTRETAEKASKIVLEGREKLIITSAQILQYKGNRVDFCTTEPKLSYKVFPGRKGQLYDEYTEQISENPIFSSVEVFFQEIETTSQGDIFYSIDLPDLREAEDAFLEIDFIGNIGNLYIHNRLVADCFFTGITWKIGLKKFKSLLREKPSIVLQIKPLLQRDNIYLEVMPDFESGKACQVNKISLTKEYRYKNRL